MQIKYYMLYLESDEKPGTSVAWSLWAIREDGMEKCLWWRHGNRTDDLEDAEYEWDWHKPVEGDSINDTIKVLGESGQEVEYVRECSEKEAFMYAL